MTVYRTPTPRNEPVREYAPGSEERLSLQETLARMMEEEVEIPLRIGGRAVTTGELMEVRPPHALEHVVARCHRGDGQHVEAAIAAAREAASTC